jgi:type I restriction enzyme S subunit
LKRFLKSPRAIEYYVGKMKGSTARRRSLPPAEFNAMPIPLPPLAEQRRIAAILDQADTLRIKRRQVLTHIDALTQSIFTEMFPGEAGTARVPLSGLATLVTKGTTPTSVGLKFSPNGVPFLRAQNLQEGTVVFGPGDLFIDEDADFALKRSRIMPRDLLISIAGTIGRVALVPDESPTMNCNQAVAIVRLLEPENGPWLRAWLASRDALSQIGASAVTGTISNLSLGQIRQLKVPIVGEDEVEEFNRRSACVEATKDAVADVTASEHQLFASLQSRAFRGEL